MKEASKYINTKMSKTHTTGAFPGACSSWLEYFLEGGRVCVEGWVEMDTAVRKPVYAQLGFLPSVWPELTY